jgi:LPS-assembly protein
MRTSLTVAPFAGQRGLALGWCIHPVAFAAAWLCLSGIPKLAHAQHTAALATPPRSSETGLKLRPSWQLQEKFTNEQRQDMPTFVLSDRMSGRPDDQVRLEGNAQLRRTGVVLRADTIDYAHTLDLAQVQGHVQLRRDGHVYEGTEGQLHLGSQQGYLLQPRFRMPDNQGRGQASRIDFLDENRFVAREASYSVWHVEPGREDSSEWMIQGSEVRTDQQTQVGVALGGRLVFKGVPILAAPYLTFPLSGERKSGWLPPTVNVDNVSGLELKIPYYLNLAPEHDATLSPTVLSRRGVNLGAEFRYLGNDHEGAAQLDVMPSDRLRNRSRWGMSVNHSGRVQTRLPAVGAVGVNLSLNRVSDDDYWRDFPRGTSSLTQRLLANDARLSWAQGPWSLYSRALAWQTLQQSTSVIIPPYDRLPQLNARYSRVNLSGWDYSLELDTTRFGSVSSLTLQPNALRSYALAQISRPFLTPGSFFIPKLQVHQSAYQFDAPLTTGPWAGKQAATRGVPSFSLDSGLIFERTASYLGRSFTQTLEPRAFYTFTPYKEQSSLPIYDSGANDFGFATIFNENAFNGHDRISDNNLLTLGLTSRFIEASSGAEVIRLSYAQRLRLSDQRVTLPGGLPDSSTFSDMLFGSTVNWSPHWQFDGTVQYNPKIQRSQRSTLSGRYTPSNYRVLSTTYRLNRGLSEQLDLAWQWPLNDLWGDLGKNLGAGRGQGMGRWYSVGRFNFSLRDKKPVDMIFGLEYDAGSWLVRSAVERLQTSTRTANKRILLQLELVGLARVGSSPLSVLQTHVPRYQLLREKITAEPSRFSNYE